MARLIVKSPYIKCGGGGSGAGSYLKYIATRERVQLIADDRPPTKRQEQLIRHLLRDFPDVKELDEYESYETAHTKCTASALISMALEMNWPEANQSEVYLKYIATRPRAERVGAHGLFGDEDSVDLEKTMTELENYQGNVWTHIISLKREDAARLGYDNANAWRDLIRAHRNDIAAAMNIPPSDFRWYAAFHDEGDHPHIHMMAWSVKPGQAYLSKDGIRKIKSELTNDIFRQEMLHIYEQKSESRDELVRQARREMKKLSKEMRQSLCSHPEVEKLMTELSQKLETVKGKKSYGYLPKNLKPLVDRIVDEMERLPAIAECYETWWELHCQVNDFYSKQDRQRPPLSRQKEFRAIKNAVIRDAELIRSGAVTFEDEDLKLEDERSDDIGGTANYRYLKRVIYDESRALNERDRAVEELRGMAEDGDPHAQYLLGKLYRDGPLLTPDTVQALDWLTRTAEQELPIAQYALGKLYLSSDLEVRDPERGMVWLERAAHNGSGYAAYRLGKEYLRGRVVEKDVSAAVEWFTQAAESGNPYAQYMLGKLYLDGGDVPKDEEAAAYWLTESASQGNDYARHLLNHPNQPPSVLLSVTRLLYHIRTIFRDNAPPRPSSGAISVDRKLRRRIQEKKVAMGHKPDDHEEYQGPSMTM